MLTRDSCWVQTSYSLHTRCKYSAFLKYLLTKTVDDMFLTTAIYSGGLFRIEAADLAAHVSWMASVNAKLPAGSNYTIEVGHNGNGNIGVCRNCSTTTRPKSLVSPSF